MPHKKTLLLDFDGTICQYTGWIPEENTILREPTEKARKALYVLSNDFELVCFTTRDPKPVREWLSRHGFPKMEVTNVKRPAFLILDDRAIRFEGKWTDELLAKIRSFEPWWKSRGA